MIQALNAIGHTAQKGKRMNSRLVIGVVVGVALLALGIARDSTVPLVVGGVLIVACGARVAMGRGSR